MARILGVGNATLDIINLVDEYPSEDDEVRAHSQQVVRGGNATNTLVALSQLGHRCAWAGTLADERDAGPILADLAHYGIDTTPVRKVPRGKVPTSYVALSRKTGSRTIVHFRDLPELGHEDYARLDLAQYDWVHFEGRNLEELRKMLAHTRERHPELRCSLEVEKPREGIEQLFPLADALLFSRVYARHGGFEKAELFLRHVHESHPKADLFCGWGDSGAYGMSSDGSFFHAPAFPPPAVVDTLGAGDVFNAGVIDGLVRNHPFESVLVEASKLAGRKCGRYGLADLVAG